MLRWALIFFIVSVVAGLFGFTGIAQGARSIAKTLFFIAIAIFVILVIAAFAIGGSMSSF